MNTVNRHYEDYICHDKQSPAEKLMAVSQFQNAMIEGLSHIYLALYIINLNEDSFLKIHAIDFVDEAISKFDSASDGVRYLVEEMLSPESVESGHEFFDQATLSERLKEKNYITMDYNGKRLGWCRGHFLAITRNEDGSVREVLYMAQRIQNEKMAEEYLRSMAELDSFTRLYNRATGEEMIDKMIKAGKGGMFCLMDVDNFKHYNDTYGHAVGDEVLLAVSDCLRKSFRKEDVLIRLGGDEFVVYAPYITDDHMADECFNRFLRNLAKLKFDAFDGNVSLSEGIVICKEHEYSSFEQVYKFADSRMYVNKMAKKERKARIEKEALLNIIADPDGEFAHKELSEAVLIYRADETEEILYASSGVCKLYECKTLNQFFKLTNKTFRGMVHPDDLERVESEIKRQISASKEMKIDYVEYKIKTAKGNIFEVKDYGHLLDTEHYGKAYYVIMMKK